MSLPNNAVTELLIEHRSTAPGVQTPPEEGVEVVSVQSWSGWRCYWDRGMSVRDY